MARTTPLHFFQQVRQEMAKVTWPSRRETAVTTAKRLTESLGGRLGTTERVIITDGGDCIAFEWRHEEGVVFPSREEVARHG